MNSMISRAEAQDVVGLKAEASRMAAQGWPVFPTVGNKSPAITGGFNSASADMAKVVNFNAMLLELHDDNKRLVPIELQGVALVPGRPRRNNDTGQPLLIDLEGFKTVWSRILAAADRHVQALSKDANGHPIIVWPEELRDEAVAGRFKAHDPMRDRIRAALSLIDQGKGTVKLRQVGGADAVLCTDMHDILAPQFRGPPKSVATQITRAIGQHVGVGSAQAERHKSGPDWFYKLPDGWRGLLRSSTP